LTQMRKPDQISRRAVRYAGFMLTRELV
jgi:hypothetical protein